MFDVAADKISAARECGAFIMFGGIIEFPTGDSSEEGVRSFWLPSSSVSMLLDGNASISFISFILKRFLDFRFDFFTKSTICTYLLETLFSSAKKYFLFEYEHLAIQKAN